MSAAVYGIRTKHNNKVYVGSSKSFDKRITTHLNRLRQNAHHNVWLQRVYNKYGESNFEFFIIEYADIEGLFDLENYYITCNNKGYNIGSVGGGDNLSNNPRKEEIKNKISKGLIKYYNSLSPEDKQQKYGKPGNTNPNWKGGISVKICPVCKVRNINPKASTCMGCKDTSGANNPFYGRKHTKQTKQLISEANKGKKHTEDSKRKITGENSGRFKGYYHTPWGVFPSSSLAQKNHDYLLSATIHRWCNNSDKIIIKQAVSRSRYLRELDKNPVGMTYKDIGFYLEPKQP